MHIECFVEVNDFNHILIALIEYDFLLIDNTQGETVIVLFLV